MEQVDDDVSADTCQAASPCTVTAWTKKTSVVKRAKDHSRAQNTDKTVVMYYRPQYYFV